MNEKDIIKQIKKDKWMMEILKIVEDLSLADWWIGAGFVRSKIWDNAHGYKRRTLIPDIDIIYFDKKDFLENEASAYTTNAEEKYQKTLKKKMPDIKWSVTNQARMHISHKDKPYKNSADALSNWVETATCIGVRLENAKVFIIAPWGVEDLVDLILRPTVAFKKDKKIFNERIKNKDWLKKWPKLKIIQ